ncbi:hypothetical protein AAVH_11016 [Aphelenchoides avenae]|nr:hypothetical protein AAVH_11016 [Aphelenchus avenae]
MRTLVFLFAVVALVAAEFDEFWEPPSRRSGSLKLDSEENDTESAKKSERVVEQRDDGFKRHEHKQKPKHDDSKEVERFSQLLEAFSKKLEAFRRDHDRSHEDQRSEENKLIRPALLSAESRPQPAKLLGRIRSVKDKKGSDEDVD